MLVLYLCNLIISIKHVMLISSIVTIVLILLSLIFNECLLSYTFMFIYTTGVCLYIISVELLGQASVIEEP